MKKIVTSLFFLLFSSIAFAQVPLKVTYTRLFNGKEAEGQDFIVVIATSTKTTITSVNQLAGKVPFPFEVTSVEHPSNKITHLARLDSLHSVHSLDSIAIGKQTFEFTSDTMTILGYLCKKAKTVVNSNRIDVWYTDKLGMKGGPSTLGQDLGFVLEINRNGNTITRATKIEKIKILPAIVNLPKGENLDILSYKDMLMKARYTTLEVFKNESINFSSESKSNDSILRFANGTVALRKVKFPVIKSGSQVFIDLTEQSTGDAYDRTGSVFMIPMEQPITFLDGMKNGIKTLPSYSNGNGKQYSGIAATDSFSPVVELMRFFTPFGINKYNYLEMKNKTWHNSVMYRQDITDFWGQFSGKEVWIGVYIGNYDKGGHLISMNITIHPEDEGTSKAPFVKSIFNSTNVMEMGGQEYPTLFNQEKGLEVTFKLDKEVKNAKLRYITTGHGGWGNGDEFVPKKNSIFLDGQAVYSITPWRQDCGSYRLYNPASGNAPNGLTSSDYSRSNWCPGTVTNPYFIDLGTLKAGIHTIRVQIPQGEPEGGSFSYWNVSGVLIGEQ